MQNGLSYREVQGRKISQDIAPRRHGSKDGGDLMMEEEWFNGEYREGPLEGNWVPCIKTGNMRTRGVSTGIINWSENWGITEIVYLFLSGSGQSSCPTAVRILHHFPAPRQKVDS